MKIDIKEELFSKVDRTTKTWKLIEQIATNIQQEEEEEAFYVCDLKQIIEKHREWMEKLPTVEPHYAVKCNDDSAILEILSSLNASFDCASKLEIAKALSVGISPERIIFANPAKPNSHIRYAAGVGVDRMTFDNDSELYKVQKLYPNARLVIRIRMDATDAQCPLGMKFGCDPQEEAPRLLKLAKSLNLNVIGVSFHVGSGCREPEVFQRAIKASRDIFNYASTLGYCMDLLDIGGGYPGVKGSSITDIAKVVNAALDQSFSDLTVKVIAEPGRYYVTQAYTLACNIHSIKKIQHEDTEGNLYETHRMYYINDGVYGSFNCILYDHQVINNPIPLRQNYDSRRISSSIWGPTCDGLDQVIDEIDLPYLDCGDWIVFQDMGAYTLPVASPFNGFPVPKVYYVMTQDEYGVFHNILQSVPVENVRIVQDQTAADDREMYCLKLPSLLNKMDNRFVQQRANQNVIDVAVG